MQLTNLDDNTLENSEISKNFLEIKDKAIKENWNELQ